MDSDLLEFIIEYKKAHDGVPPSIREMARFLACGHQLIYKELDILELNRIIERGPGARNIQIIGGQWLPPA